MHMISKNLQIKRNLIKTLLKANQCMFQILKSLHQQKVTF